MPSRVRTPTLDIVLELPRSVRLATWGTALLTGGVPMSAAVAAVSGDDEPHDVRTARPLEADLQAAPGARSSSDLAGLLEGLRAAGVSGLRVALPAPGDLLGLPGPVDRAKLLSMAGKIGVGESTRFLAKHKGTFARLAAPGGFTGEKFLQKCAAQLTDPESGLEGLHVFTFNQVAETEQWHRELLDRLTSHP